MAIERVLLVRGEEVRGERLEKAVRGRVEWKGLRWEGREGRTGRRRSVKVDT
jgi:hypothetical protein